MCSIQGFHSGFSQFGPLSQDLGITPIKGWETKEGVNVGPNWVWLYGYLYSIGHFIALAGLGIQQGRSLALQGKSKLPRNKRTPTINFASTLPHSCTAKARHGIMTSQIWTHNSSVECAGLGFISQRRRAPTLYEHIYVPIRAYHDNIPTFEQWVFEEFCDATKVVIIPRKI
jgi:hypothetical protein